MKSKWLVGVDEVGRGPLAGPVGVGVAMVPGNFCWEQKLPGVTDSKKLTEKRREEIFLEARRLKAAGQLDFAVAMVSAAVIDRIGIVKAIELAQQRALNRVLKNLPRVPLGRESEVSNFPRQDLRPVRPAEVLVKLDGGLTAPPEFVQQETIIKGDALEPVIGLASIVAKVTRDRYMVRKADLPLFAPYDFAAHKGYGTQFHRTQINQLGLTVEHRKTFCKNLAKPL